MKNLKSLCFIVAVALISVISNSSEVLAATGLAGNDQSGGKVGLFLGGVLNFINGILIPLILGIAFLMFVWGVFKFFILGGSDEEKQSEGKSLMIYAVAGFVLILSFYGIVNIVVNGIGAGNGTAVVPRLPL